MNELRDTLRGLAAALLLCLLQGLSPAPAAYAKSQDDILGGPAVPAEAYDYVFRSTKEIYTADNSPTGLFQAQSLPPRELMIQGHVSWLDGTSCTEKVLKEAVLYAQLRSGREHQLGSNAFAVQIPLKIDYTHNSVPQTIRCTLNIDQAAPEQVYKFDFTTLHTASANGDVEKFTLTIESFNNTWSADTDVDARLHEAGRVELAVFYTEEWQISGRDKNDRFRVLVETEEVLGTVNPTSFSWHQIDACPGEVFPSYELQVMRLFNIDRDNQFDEYTIKAEVDWEEALSIETGSSATLQTLSLTEGRGYYIWRVRPIGNLHGEGGADARNLGPWSATPDVTSAADGRDYITINGAAADHSVFFYHQFDDNKNWIYDRAFSEGLRIHEGINYATSLLQARQTQVYSAGRNVVLASQSVLDYSGRAALTSLSAPTGQNALGYHFGLLQTGGTVYSAQHFDADYANPSPLQGGAVADYYSDANPDLSIPGAEGFPFQRTAFYHDGTERLREQGGLGPAHRVGAPHSVKTFYGGVADQEIVALFGDETPKPQSVIKSVTLDPNGTASISYISLDNGKTLATCLAQPQNPGPTPRLLPLPTVGEGAEAVLDLAVDDHVESESSTRRLGEFALVGGKSIVFDAANQLEISYDIEPNVIDDGCLQFCRTCDYLLVIVVEDSDGVEVFRTDPPLEVAGTQLCSSPELPAQLQNQVVPIAQPGAYTVKKYLRANNPIAVVGGQAPALQAHLSDLEAELWNKLETDPQLVAVKAYLSADPPDLEGLDDYIEESLDGERRITIDNCVSLEIPARSDCEDHACDEGLIPSFEEYLYDKWGHIAVDPGDPDFDSKRKDPNKYFWTGNTLTLPPALRATPSAPGRWADGNWQGVFDLMIQHMVDDGYSCAELWRCWRSVVDNFGTMAKRPYAELSSSYRSTVADGEEYANAIIEADNRQDNFDLMDAFLNCAGRSYRDIVDGGATGPMGYLEYAYKYIYFDPKDLNDGGRGAECKTLLEFDKIAPWQDEQAMWEALYRCLNEKEIYHDIGISKTFSLSDLAQRCESNCAARFFEFYEIIEQAYRNAGKKIEGDELGPGESYDITRRELACMAHGVVEHCAFLCDPNDYEANLPGLLYKLRVALPIGMNCPVGPPLSYQLLPGAAPDLNQVQNILDLYINPALDDFRDKLASASEGFWYSELQDLLHLHLPDLDVCCLDERILVAKSDVDAYVEIQGCDLVFTRVTSASTSIILCSNLCDPCPDICIAWENIYEDPPVNNYPEGPPNLVSQFNCEWENAAQILASLNLQMSDFVRERMAAFSDNYKLQCVNPATLVDDLQLKYDLSYYHYTLYYHDRAGNLTRTVPPAGVKLQIPADLSRQTPTLHEMITHYAFNSLGQLIWQNTPDGGDERFWYDALGRLRFSQNAQQALDMNFSFTRYDELGRVTDRGECTEVFSTLHAQPYYELADEAEYPNSDIRDRIANVYTTPDPGTVYPVGEHAGPQRYLRNRVAQSSREQLDALGASVTVASYFSYDPHGNVEWLAQDIPGLGRKFIRYEYDLYSGNVLQVIYNEGMKDQFIQRYTYDGDNRLLRVSSSRDGLLWDRDGEYEDYDHGPQRRLELGEDRVQGVDNVYTIHGWLKALNHPDLGDRALDPGKDGLAGSAARKEVAYDAFGMVLGYYSSGAQGSFADFKRSINGGAVQSVFNADAANQRNLAPDITYVRNLYNGNISTWTAKSSVWANGLASEAWTGNSFIYDELNRIIHSHYFSYGGGVWPPTPGDDYLSEYAYDPNGNILSLQRWSSGTLMDDLSYDYSSGGAPWNRLQSVTETVSTPPLTEDIDLGTHNYSYDAIGNLTVDPDQTIQWDAYGKVRRIVTTTFPAKQIEFFYDAQGNRVKKRYSGAAPETQNTYYVRAADGKVLASYNASEVSTHNEEVRVAEWIIYGRQRLGMATADGLVINGNEPLPASDYCSRRIGDKRYELTDHLGNIRAVISDIKEPLSVINTDLFPFVPEVLSFNNYYPFGMLQPGRYGQSGDYRYGFNGKEMDNEVKGVPGTQYDYGFRIYDPRIGKFLSEDPLTKEYPMLTPYQFASNTPIQAIDLDGLEAVRYSAPVPYSNPMQPVWEGFARAIEWMADKFRSSAGGELKLTVPIVNKLKLKQLPVQISDNIVLTLKNEYTDDWATVLGELRQGGVMTDAELYQSKFTYSLANEGVVELDLKTVKVTIKDSEDLITGVNTVETSITLDGKIRGTPYAITVNTTENSNDEKKHTVSVTLFDKKKIGEAGISVTYSESTNKTPSSLDLNLSVSKESELPIYDATLTVKSYVNLKLVGSEKDE